MRVRVLQFGQQVSLKRMSSVLARLAVLLGVLFVAAAKSAATAGADWYYDNWCGGSLEYLDDGKCVKLFPGSTADRTWQCPTPSLSKPSDAFQPDAILKDVVVDTTALAGVVNDADVNLCVIVTQRVADPSSSTGVRLYNKYLCAGDYSANVAYETWSSSKVFAMANAAGHLRTNETTCGDGNAENHKFGLDGSVTGKHGVTPLGDLATVVCSYDETAGYSSNSLSSYFHDIGWRGRINGLVQDWLLVGQNTTSTTLLGGDKEVRSDLPQTLGGNYGEASPSDLGLDVTAHSTTSTTSTTTSQKEKNAAATRSTTATTSATTSATTAAEDCQADKDPWPVVYSNSLSALSAAELVRRIALHRELPQALQFPGATWDDIQTILYGAGEQSALFPGQVWGGMSADTAIFTQAGLDLPSLLQQWDPAQHNQWRLFSKLGAGYSTSRSRGEIVSNAYSCLPRYDVSGAVVGGLEFTIAARGSVPYDSSLKQVEQKLHEAMDRALQYTLTNYAT